MRGILRGICVVGYTKVVYAWKNTTTTHQPRINHAPTRTHHAPTTHHPAPPRTEACQFLNKCVVRLPGAWLTRGKTPGYHAPTTHDHAYTTHTPCMYHAYTRCVVDAFLH